MELSKPNKQLFDLVRKKWVEATPEEIIRQQLLEEMVGELGYPLSFLSVEKELSLLPHLSLIHRDAIPKRRADVIVFAKGIHPEYALFPLLLIECKALPLTPKFASQVVGYNTVVQAPFLTLANGEETLTGYFDPEAGNYQFNSGLPSYDSLLAEVHKVKWAGSTVSP